MNEHIVVLTGSPTNNSPVHVFENKKNLSKRLKQFEESEETCLYIIHPDLDDLLNQVTKCFKYVEAAGGLVMHPDGRILFIERLGKWDLPKGKAEKGESLQETAIREVMEECGLKKAPVITGILTHTYHTYHRNGKHILKHTAWFTMLYDGDDDLHPQTSEDISTAVWLQKNQLDIVLQNTYKSIKQVIQLFSDSIIQ